MYRLTACNSSPALFTVVLDAGARVTQWRITNKRIIIMTVW